LKLSNILMAIFFIYKKYNFQKLKIYQIYCPLSDDHFMFYIDFLSFCRIDFSDLCKFCCKLD